MKSFCIVNTEDWAGLYVEGELVDEGHDISQDTLVSRLQEAGVDIRTEEMTKEADMKMCESGDQMPGRLEDVAVRGRKKH